MKSGTKWMALGLLMPVLGLAGCETENPESCEYWIKRLQSPAKAQEAIVQVTDMKCDAAVEPLKKLFDEGQFQDESLTAIAKLGNKDAAKDVISRALRIQSLGSKAANLVNEHKIAEAKPGLVEVLTKPRNPDARPAALEALIAVETDKAALEDVLIQVLNDDPAVQGLAVNARAAEELGKLKSEKAVPSLINALFVRTASKQEVYTPARNALNAIGAPAVPALISAIRGELESLNQFVTQKSIPRWMWQEGPKLAQVLGDLRDPRAAVPVAENLARDLEPIEGMTEAVKNEWIQNQSNRLVIGMISLGQIGSDEPAELLAKLIPGQNERDTSQRLNAATALAFIGSEAAVDALFKAYEADKDYRFKAALLLPIAMGLDFKRMAAWDAITEYIKPRPEQIKEGKDLYFEQFVLKEQLEDKDVGPRIAAYVNAVKECESNLSCFQRKLESDDLSTRMKAALMLTRQAGQSGDIFDALLGAFKASKPDEIDLRRFILMGLGRHGNKAKAGIARQYAEVLKERGKGELYWAEEMIMVAHALDRKN